MTREQLVQTLQKLLATKAELDFLLKLDPPELERLVALIRDRLDQK